MGRIRQLIWVIVAVGLLTGCATQPMPHTAQTESRPAEKAATITPMNFPQILPDGLVAEKLSTYTGPYWEDGSEEYVEKVTALTVYNPTEQMLGFGAFAVEQAGETIYFFVHRLPPNSRCLVLAYAKKTCDLSEVTACRELSIRWEYPQFSREQLDYVCLGKKVTVINRDVRVLRQVTVWYKRYDRAGDCYMGGIAYAAYLHAMQPQEQRTLQPSHYDAADARIVGIELEI
ncbi:MAG: hypothetical protein E7447_03830 [Ruminococcaceae bacterium]|nr:hypothetical protein [Oscillospiraceae bacterium]